MSDKCKSSSQIITDFKVEQSTKQKYKNLQGKEGAYWEIFFIEPPKECGDVLFAKTTMHEEHLIESFWNNHFSKTVFYNAFICENGVAHYTFDKEKSRLKEQIVCFEDEEFLLKLPKKPRDFYEKSLEWFLELAKEKITKGKSVVLHFESYKFQLSKYKFFVWRDDALYIKNFIKEVEYDEFGNIIINPYTNKVIKFQAPKIIYEFFRFYLQKRQSFQTTDESGVVYTNDALQLVEATGITVVYFFVLFGVLAFVLFIEAKLFHEPHFIHFLTATVVSLVLAELVADYLNTRCK